VAEQREPDGGTVGDREVVRVVCDVAGLSRRFDYLVPEKWRGQLRVGSRVRVALQGRRVGAWVVGLDPEPPSGIALSELTGNSGLGPPPAVVDLAEWAAWRWAGPVSFFLKSASPSTNTWSLPARPPAASPSVELADPALSEIGRRLAAGEGSRLLRVGPCADPLPLLEGLLAGHAASGRPGSVLVLVPAVGWSERLTERLARRGVAVVHEPSDWARAAAGWPVVVGTRASALAPLPLLGAAVVLDAHDESYRDERSPNWSAIDVVVERARRDGAPLVLVSATPTAALLEAAPLLTMAPAREHSDWPRLVVCDRRGADPRTGLIGDELVALFRRLLEDGSAHPDRPVVAVLNRTGRARLLACADCGELVRCEHCGRALAEGGDELVCPGCARVRPRVCAACGSTRLKVLRAGVARVATDLSALVGEEAGEVAGPPRGAQGHEGWEGRRVLLGTEAVLHRVRRAAVVAFLDFDQHLLSSRTDAQERALALLARAGRLVGARSAKGAAVVFVQTRLPDEPVLAAAVRGDPGPLGAAELALRRQLAIPPFSVLAIVSGPGAPEYVAQLHGVEVTALEGDRHLVRATEHAALCDALARVPRGRAGVRVEVDPQSV